MTAPTPASAHVTGQVAEVFRSYQGEGLLLGRRQVFVRLAGCTVGCRYCDTEWAFQPPADVAVPRRTGERLPNPMTAAQVASLVEAADPAGGAGGPAPVSLTGGEPTEQAAFCAALLDSLAGREVMLETAALDAGSLARLVPNLRWVAADLKLPSATGQADVLDRHERVLSTGVLDQVETFFKLVVDGDTTDDEVARAADLLARHAAGRPVFLQPVTPMGGSPALPGERLDALVDLLASRFLPVRVVPQVHKVLRVR